MKYLAVILFLSGCVDAKHQPFPPPVQVSVKYCLDQCIGETFSNFHERGRAWGAGASSMNGLSQSQIFDRVEAYCAKFYRGEKCCEAGASAWRNIQTVHGYNYGACKAP